MPIVSRIGLWIGVSVVACVGHLVADELHVRIDQLIAAKSDGPMSATADDAEFLRRVFLDLAGRIPSATESVDFSADTASDKRMQAIDRLLNSDEYARRMTDAFHVMLIERLGDHDEWRKFLRESFAANKPWDQMTREIVCPNAENEATRGSAFFLSKRLENYGQNPVDLPGLVRDVGRLFLGVDVQCAQCHDHLFVNEYKQQDYHGLFMFVGQTTLRTDVPFPAVTEKLVTEKAKFQSVFTKEEKMVGPRLPGGTEVTIPTYAKGEEFVIAPDRKKNIAGSPKFSPLRILADELPRTGNETFARNIVNRLWWLMMGRGLVTPLDLHHGDNPPSHPELLKLLADEFAAQKFNIRWLLREIALTDVYQRSSVLPADAAKVRIESYRTALEKPLSAEQLMASLLQATGPRTKLIVNEQAKTIHGLPMKETTELFGKAFANPAREPEVEHSPSLRAALFLSNNDRVLSWLKPQDENLVDRMLKLNDANPIADELYLSVLSRKPIDEERVEVAALLAKYADQRPDALGRLAWALLTSAEFCVNH